MGRSAARLGDGVSHGVIVSGSSSVLIGDQGAVACSVCPGGLQVGAPVVPIAAENFAGGDMNHREQAGEEWNAANNCSK